MIQQVFEALPVKASTLTSPVQPLQQNLHCSAVKLLNPVSIAFHSVVVVITTELPVQLREQEIETKIAILPAPLGEVGDRVAELLPGCSTHDVRLARAVFVPAKLEAEKVEPRASRPLTSTESNDSSLVSSQREAVLLKPKLKRFEESIGVFLIFERADEI